MLQKTLHIWMCMCMCMCMCIEIFSNTDLYSDVQIPFGFAEKSTLIFTLFMLKIVVIVPPSSGLCAVMHAHNVFAK